MLFFCGVLFSFLWLARGKLGLQITFADNAKVETQTLVFETDEIRKAWLDDMKKFIQLCGPIKLSDRQIQQSSSKILTWMIKKREQRKGSLFGNSETSGSRFEVGFLYFLVVLFQKKAQFFSFPANDLYYPANLAQPPSHQERSKRRECNLGRWCDSCQCESNRFFSPSLDELNLDYVIAVCRNWEFDRSTTWSYWRTRCCAPCFQTTTPRHRSTCFSGRTRFRRWPWRWLMNSSPRAMSS